MLTTAEYFYKMGLISSSIQGQRLYFFFFKTFHVIVLLKVKDSHLYQKYILWYKPEINMYLNTSLICDFLIVPSTTSACTLAHSTHHVCLGEP